MTDRAEDVAGEEGSGRGPTGAAPPPTGPVPDGSAAAGPTGGAAPPVAAIPANDGTEAASADGDAPLRVAALGDIHVKDDVPPGLRPLFADVSASAGALVLCGDLTDTGKVSEAEVLAEELRGCTVPVMAVLGNHDHDSDDADAVRAVLRQAGVKLIEGQSCEVGGVGFVGAKGFAGGFGQRMLGAFGEAATKRFVAEAMAEAMQLENAMRTVKARRSMVVLHYAPVVDTIVGEPAEIYPFLGCSRLAETIDRFPVDVVVHGHAHRGTYAGRTPRGTPVFNVAYGIDKPSGKAYALIDL